MSDLFDKIAKDFDKKYEIPKIDTGKNIDSVRDIGIKLDILAKNTISAFEDIAKDIRKRQDNAMAMEFTKCIGELLKNNGVTPKITEYHQENHTTSKFEMRYGVSIDELDFFEHDKVFEDKIAKLEKENKELNLYLVNREQDSTDMLMELKQRIAELENELEKKECIKTMRIEFHADNGEMLTSLEVANSLINQNTFNVDELRELSEFLQVYCNHHEDRDIEPNVMLF